MTGMSSFLGQNFKNSRAETHPLKCGENPISLIPQLFSLKIQQSIETWDFHLI